MIIMTYLYLLINSLISFIKDNLFLLINVSTTESLSASQASQLLESIDDIWESPKYDSASRAMTSLDNYYGFSPIETQEFEYLFDSIFNFFFSRIKRKKRKFY
jgi:hypothetical protein